MKSVHAVRVFLLLILVASVALAADDSEIEKGFENLRNVQAVAQILDFRRAMGTTPQFDAPLLDPWGTPYRIDIEEFRIVGAGSDRTFDETTWTTREQFAGLEGDVVFKGGQMLRSNRNWLSANMSPNGKSAVGLRALRAGEIRFMIMRTAGMRQATALQVSTRMMEELSALAVQYRSAHGDFSKLAPAPDPAAQLVSEANGNPRFLRDAWGTPLRLIVDGDKYRVISAGADRKFEPDTWSQAAKQDATEDIILENGAFIRRVDERALLKEFPPIPEPLAQPTDPVPPSHLDRTKWNRVGDGVKAPVVIERLEPVYPDDYRRLRLTGILILECEIAATGEIGQIRVIKSVAPDFDMAGVDAVRQWKFKPAERDGKPVPVLFNLTINFKLK